jgi:hypothetical protein
MFDSCTNAWSVRSVVIMIKEIKMYNEIAALK